jgi:hypothetical protein
MKAVSEAVIRVVIAAVTDAGQVVISGLLQSMLSS